MARIGILSAWTSRLGGGVFEAVVAHCAMVRACGHEPLMFGLEDDHSADDHSRFDGIEVTACRVSGPRMIGYAPKLLPALEAAKLDLLHLHGIWMYPSHAASDWAARSGRPYVISPHGMLDPWITSRGTIKKAVARFAYERQSWRRATLFHALTAREASDIVAATGCIGSPLVIPNAVPPASLSNTWAEPPTLLYLGRLHPKKNIDALIAGWRMAGDVLRPIGARLAIAGWGEPDDVARLREIIGDHEDITFLGPIYGERKAALLASSRFLALPSLSEGLPVVVLEAWAAGTPTLMSAHCNLPEGFAAGAAIDCGTAPGSIANALRTGFTMSPPRREEMSQAASALATGRFSPEHVTRAWADGYGRLLDTHHRNAA